jgi:hypothetical protein
MFSTISRLAVAMLCLQAWSLISVAVDPNQPEVQATLGQVKDIRPNGTQLGKLEIEIKLSMNKLPADATHYRVVVTKAIADTGIDLMSPEGAALDFRPVHEHGGGKVSLKSPGRTSTHVRELDGEVQLLVPKKDPDATVKVSAVGKSLGKAIESKSLKSAGIEITPASTEQYMKIEAADDQASMRQGFGFNRVGPNDIALRVKDPHKKLVSLEFVDAAGKKIPAGFIFTTSQRGSESRSAYIFQFQSPLPPTASLLIHLVTDKALVKVPFTLTDIALP